MSKIKNHFLFSLLLVLVSMPCMTQGFMNTVQQGKHEVVKALLQKHVFLVSMRDARLNTPLHVAAGKGDIEMVKLLLAAGADVNARDNLGRTALHRAISPFGSNTDLLDLLLDNGADTTIPDMDGNPAISSAIDGIKLEVVKKLLEGKFDINRKLRNESTILHQAAERGNLELMEFLIDRGADVKAANEFGITPLHVAAVYGHKEAAGLLITKGADPNARSRWCGTPLHQAEAAGYPVLAAFLREHGGVKEPPEYPTRRGLYLGQEPPGENPQLFAPKILQNLFRWAKPPAFTPDGRELYWSGSAPHGNGAKIWTMRRENGGWTYPAATSFSGLFKDQLACLSPGGRRLLFNSRRPLEDGGKLKDADLWMVERTGSGWSEPVNLGLPVNTGGHEMRASIAASGNLYLDSDQYPDNMGAQDIYMARPDGSGYAQPENAGPEVNSRFLEAYPAVAPDESFLIFGSDRPGGFGDIDLYISFREADGSWTPARNMGKKMNATFKIWPSISGDGRYFLYVSGWRIYWQDITELVKTLRELPYTDILSAWSRVIAEDGIEQALTWYRRTQKKYGDYYHFSEANLITMGYRLLGMEKINEALAVFKLAVHEFPRSWNAFDSYGEALMKAGRYEAAVSMYEKSLQLDPANNNATGMLQRLREKIDE